VESLKRLVAELPASFPASIFVVIHIPNDAPSLLPDVLNASGPLTAVHPEDGEPIKKGVIYVAPPDHHMRLRNGIIRVTRGPRENRSRPAIDPLFRSAARAYGSRVAAVILSGQLDDGSAGLLAVRARGGATIVQDPREAPWADMPANALQYASADYVLPVTQIAPLLGTLAAGAGPPTQPAVSDAQQSKGGEGTVRSEQDDYERGKQSEFACPECHGVLWEIKDGDLLRFRCRTGHAYTAESLHVALTEAVEDALWIALRVLEEKAALLRRTAMQVSSRFAGRQEESAQHYEAHADTIRQLLGVTSGDEAAKAASKS
jgi:two-component system chemotaxis response regulator CheB